MDSIKEQVRYDTHDDTAEYLSMKIAIVDSGIRFSYGILSYHTVIMNEANENLTLIYED